MATDPYPETNYGHSRDSDFFRSIRLRVLASIAGSVAWLGLTLNYLAFWAHGFSLLQNIVIVVVSLLVLGAVLIGSWISFGFRFVGHWTD